MSYQCDIFKSTGRAVSITFCSCVLPRTEIEQKPIGREVWIMWFKDVAAGAGLVVFMAASFAFVSSLQAILHML
jgi:hypothetical protein